MPRVKVDYVVSFSSEDPENQASNLLAWEVNKKKWLCSKGEPSCSIVLQLSQSVQICTVQVGAHHSALVEVLVGRSETPNEPFQVLVPRSVFLSPAESRRAVEGAGADRVRSFGASDLAVAVAAQRWDRVRVVCSQPYDKHSKYGLSFVHIYSPEAPFAPAVPALAAFSSDEEDEFRPGELYAQHRGRQGAPSAAACDTGAQIRQATSQALKNIPDSSIKLTKTTLTKTDKSRSSRTGEETVADRQREGLLYSADDERPRARVERAVAAHRDRRARDDAAPRGPSTNGSQLDDTHNKTPNRNRPSGGERRRDTPSERDREGPSGARNGSSVKKKDGTSVVERKGDDHSRKLLSSDRKADSDPEGPALIAGPRSATPHTLLRDVVFVLSGYENPRRAAIRAAALALGAACERDWGPRCTHLICAFPNTPKFKQVRAADGGARAVAVRGEWVEQTARRRRRLPWQWFATEAPRRVAPPPDTDEDDALDEECDTDDEIERVRQKMKKRRSRSPPPVIPPGSPPPTSAAVADVSTNSDVTFIRDERMQGAETAVESDGSLTEEEAGAESGEEVDPRAGLPDLFRGRTFALAPAVRGAARLARYVHAYGGLVLHVSACCAREVCVAAECDATDCPQEALSAEGGAGADYVLCDGEANGAEPRGAVRVRAAWLWRCHAARRLCALDEYRLA